MIWGDRAKVIGCRALEGGGWPTRALYTPNGVLYDPQAPPGHPLHYEGAESP